MKWTVLRLPMPLAQVADGVLRRAASRLSVVRAASVTRKHAARLERAS